MYKKTVLTSKAVVLVTAVVALFLITTAVITPLKISFATTNEIDNFATEGNTGNGEDTGDSGDGTIGTTEETSGTDDSSGDSSLSSTETTDDPSGDLSFSDNSQFITENTDSDSKDSFTTNSVEIQNSNENNKTNISIADNLDSNNKTKSDAKVATKPFLVNPNAYNYQINPDKSTITIYQNPIQKINTLVTDSFSHGVSNIPLELKVMDPAKKIKIYSGKTDAAGKSSVMIPITTAGIWKADVTVKSPPTVGGPFKDTISWKAIGNIPTSPPVPPIKTSKVTYASKIAYNPVDLSNDPRQQIMTTVKNPLTNSGIKNVPLTIKLTNADGLSKTFSRITDSKGVDEFVTSINKAGTWKALMSVKGSNGVDLYKKEIIWKAIP